MPFNQVIVPVDFSERSRGAILYAEALHREFGSKIVLVHVLTPPHYEVGAIEVGGAVLEDLFRNRQEEAKNQLHEISARDVPAAAVERILLEGEPAGQIVKLAHERESSLIVMPTHGYGPFRRFILGSVTAKVLHDADCPVWTGVHLEAQSIDEIRFRTVIAAVDLGPQTERTLMWASRFAAETGASLEIVHAGPNLEGKAGEYFDPEWKAHMTQAIREELTDLKTRLGLTNEIHVDHGDAAQTVCRMSADLKANLLVIGRGSASGVFGRMRANAYSIIRLSHCPVVSV